MIWYSIDMEVVPALFFRHSNHRSLVDRHLPANLMPMLHTHEDVACQAGTFLVDRERSLAETLKPLVLCYQI